MIPIAGSAYTYSYATMGELVAWIIGWDLVLEYAVGAATVAIAWSEYLNRVLEWVGLRIPYEWSHSPFESMAGSGVHGHHEPAGRVHPAGLLSAAADSRHPGVGLRQQPDRRHQGAIVLMVIVARLGVHQPGEPHAVHSRADDSTRRRRASRTTTAASWGSSARRASCSSPSSASTRSRPRRRKPRTRSATCRSASSARW